jgi:hypothetical protein
VQTVSDIPPLSPLLHLDYDVTMLRCTIMVGDSEGRKAVQKIGSHAQAIS